MSKMLTATGMKISEKDKEIMIEAIQAGEISFGKYNKLAEKELTIYEEQDYAALVNSGSSANLLAFASMFMLHKVKPGDEIITTATAFPTTIAPIIQYSCIPVFVDVDRWYNIDIEAMKKALTPRTRGVFIAHTLGIPYDIFSVFQFCYTNGLFLISDCCDALGSIYRGNKVTHKAYSDVVTNSFYPAHHITAGEGGAVLTSKENVIKLVKSLRDWGRACSCDPGKDNKCGKRFEQTLGNLPKGYDHKYTYTHFGYNFKMTNIQAALLYSQLSEIDNFTKIRQENFQTIYHYLYPYVFNYELSDGVVTDYTTQREEGTIPNWFGFPVMLPQNVNRANVIKKLETQGIGTRLLFAGNITKQPIWHGEKYRIAGSLVNTDRIMNQMFWIGCWQGLNEDDAKYIGEKTLQTIQEETC